MPPAKPGGRPSAADLANAELVQEALGEELTRVQKSAQGWATALTGMTGLIATLTVVKGESTIEDLSQGAKVLVAVFVVAAIALGVWGAYCAARAANGMPTAIESGKLMRSRHQAASRAREWLAFAIRSTVFAVGCAVTAVLIAWFGTEASTASLKVLVGEHTYCGKVKTSSDKFVEFDKPVTLTDGSIAKTFNLAGIDALEPVSSCD